MDGQSRVSTQARASLTREEVLRDVATNTPQDAERKRAALLVSSEVSESDMLGTLRAFARCVFSGTTPPTYALILVAESIGRYFDARGETTLDQAFNLAPVQKAGHPITARQRRAKLDRLCFQMWQLRKASERSGKRLSIEAAAGEIVNRYDLTESEDTLKSHYVKHRFQTKWDQAQRILSEALAKKSPHNGEK
jgi:hypothetical protein